MARGESLPRRFGTRRSNALTSPSSELRGRSRRWRQRREAGRRSPVPRSSPRCFLEDSQPAYSDTKSNSVAISKSSSDTSQSAVTSAVTGVSPTDAKSSEGSSQLTVPSSITASGPVRIGSCPGIRTVKVHVDGSVIGPSPVTCALISTWPPGGGTAKGSGSPNAMPTLTPSSPPICIETIRSRSTSRTTAATRMKTPSARVGPHSHGGFSQLFTSPSRN